MQTNAGLNKAGRRFGCELHSASLARNLDEVQAAQALRFEVFNLEHEGLVSR